ncbi:hypothetical protein AsAng_0012070 [Aureispira anguillae]|uniref:Uncharacterized protein n=1 Tax=Aureispira anguillae TaxID=2864201 RepID=A0A915YCD7_9BACT|nr:hypothetical protein AsAng_0012070 [Aureispira anguillae]
MFLASYPILNHFLLMIGYSHKNKELILNMSIFNHIVYLI